MVEKMKCVSITGLCSEIDRVSENYLSNYDIQLEYALKELPNEKGLQSFVMENPYTSHLRKAEKLVRAGDYEKISPKGFEKETATHKMDKETAIKLVESGVRYMESITRDIAKLEERLKECQEVAKAVEPYISLNFNVENLSEFEFIVWHFGRMPCSSSKQFEKYLADVPEILFVTDKNDGNYIWCLYFTVHTAQEKVETIFSSLHFEKVNFPLELNGEALKGTPRAIYEKVLKEAERLSELIKTKNKSSIIDAVNDERIDITKQGILDAYYTLKRLHNIYDARKYAAKTPGYYFVFVGWMTEKDAESLSRDMEKDNAVTIIIEDNNQSNTSTPPIKLRNNMIVKPFEFFVKMYGLPSYGELDPTPFVALTYTVLFGIMFGDLGQGIILSLLGFYLERKRKMPLGSIMAMIGVSSAAFGVLFGSFFGYEFHALWFHPATPENINSTLMYAVGLGIALMLISMTFNFINAYRQKKLKDILFSPNGVSGFVFYTSALVYAMFALNGTNLPALFIVLFMGLPLAFIAFKEPVLNILNGKKPSIHGGLGLYIFECFIELFETVLSFFTNTVSYIRVGAFALSHASIMSVVWLLSTSASGTNNIFIIILGNILVMALEGLIVGIQVLRLEFYEMFSRFYTGGGREFEAYKLN